MNESLDAWFASEILIHEQALTYYLRRCWPQRDELHDLRQEIYVRVYEAAGKALPTAPKSFLFATARHLMADRVRRSRVVSIEAVGDFEPLNVLVDEISPERWFGGRQIGRDIREMRIGVQHLNCLVVFVLFVADDEQTLLFLHVDDGRGGTLAGHVKILTNVGARHRPTLHNQRSDAILEGAVIAPRCLTLACFPAPRALRRRRD